jgi:serine/threonine protein phosphatase PrpC
MNNKPVEMLVAETAHFCWGAETHIGMERQENQDRFFADPEPSLFLVSDGMGGHRGGALASGIVAEDLPVMIENALDRLKVGTPRTVRSLLERMIAEQSKQLQLEGTSKTGYKDMGATLVVALLRKGRCFVANIGDSRAYLLRNGRMVQLTHDHSVVSELIEKGRIEPEKAANHDALGQITRYIGMEEKAHSYICSFTLKKGDRLLLCTDGLTDMLDDVKIAAILTAETDPQATCESLVAAANKAGGYDNTTTLVIDWLGPG